MDYQSNQILEACLFNRVPQFTASRIVSAVVKLLVPQITYCGWDG